MVEVRRYQRLDGAVPLTDWLAGLRDRRVRAKLEIRFRRVSLGIFGDIKPVGEDVPAEPAPEQPEITEAQKSAIMAAVDAFVATIKTSCGRLPRIMTAIFSGSSIPIQRINSGMKAEAGR